MLNYIKSEFYRAAHSSEIHGTALGLGGLVVLLNLILYLMKDLEGFRYGSTSFSYSNLVSMPMLYCYVAADVAAMLYEADRKNGTLGNSISFGLSRMQIFGSKCVVCFGVSFLLLLILLPLYIGSAQLLPASGPTTVKELLLEIPAMSLIATGALILAVLLLDFFENSFFSVLTWFAVLVILPKVLLLAGMALASKTEFLLEIAMWMPVNFLTAQSQVNLSECITVWSTGAGMAKCLLSGAAGIVVFGAAGVLLLRKKEI